MSRATGWSADSGSGWGCGDDLGGLSEGGLVTDVGNIEVFNHRSYCHSTASRKHTQPTTPDGNALLVPARRPPHNSLFSPLFGYAAAS